MSASELIEQIQRLPDDQAKQVYDYLFSTERELDRVLAAFDRLPRKNRLSEDKLSASRVQVLLDSNVCLAILTTRILSSHRASVLQLR